jgi:hypothetical protein
MRDFVASLLGHEGALVEAIEPDGLEVLAPPAVRDALGVGELSRFGFGAALPPGATRVGIEGDWLTRFARLLGPRGRWRRRVLVAPDREPADPERTVERALTLDNATYRVAGISPAWTRYLVVDFRATAVSDEKRDFLASVAINLATGALPDEIIETLMATDDESEADRVVPPNVDLPASWTHTAVLARIGRALPPRLDMVLEPFVKGLRRRLGRDQDRLHRYHDDLYREAMERAARFPEDDPRWSRERQRGEAIEREYRSRLDDLSRRYATRVTVEWSRTLELVMPVRRFSVRIRRRKAERLIELDWNPIVGRLESPVCDFTFSADRPRLACDDALHLVVPAGLGPCVGCGREYCRVCHPARCPKCGVGHPAMSGAGHAMFRAPDINAPA